MGKAKSKPTPPANSDSRRSTIPLEELALEQGVQPVSDLEALGALWPAEHDPDAFLAFVQSERAARRQIAHAKTQKRD
jgi:hypothetical protein